MSKLEFLYSRKHFLHWFLMAFVAGTVNAGGFMACQRFVSHVTGFATLAGVDIARGSFIEAFGILTVPLFFLGGAMLAAILVERRHSRGDNPRHSLAMALVAFFLFLATAGGQLHWFGAFGAPLKLKSDYLLLALLCSASGIQNALITSVSGGVVRTTHLTGITTDLGLGLVRTLYQTGEEQRLRKEKQFNRLRVGTLFSFVAGSLIGAMAFLSFEYLGFLLPAMLASYMALAAPALWEERHPDHAEGVAHPVP